MLESIDTKKEFRVIDRRTGFRGMVADVVKPKRVARVALDGVTRSFAPGRRACIAGRNGSGKSTFLKILAGAMIPTSGEVRYNGSGVRTLKNRYKRAIGVVFGHRGQLIWELALAESLQFLRFVYSLEKREYEDRLGMLVEQLRLRELLNVPIREMSLGQRMRSEVAAALIHTPSVLILDEATIGLDVSVKSDIYRLIRHIGEVDGSIVIFSTHDIHDIVTLADDLLILEGGRLVYDGPPKAFIDEHSQYTKITLQAFENLPAVKSRLPDGIEILNLSTERIVLRADHKRGMELLKDAALIDLVDSATVEDETLHDILDRFYREA